MYKLRVTYCADDDICNVCTVCISLHMHKNRNDCYKRLEYTKQLEKSEQILKK